MQLKDRKRKSELDCYRADDSLWYWRVVSGNGWVVGSGKEGYATKSNAKRGFARMLKGLGLPYLADLLGENT